jgi:hypothetical protein
MHHAAFGLAGHAQITTNLDQSGNTEYSVLFVTSAGNALYPRGVHRLHESLGVPGSPKELLWSELS